MTVPGRPRLYRRIREILESARAGAARSVNTTQVVANWLIGREIVEEEQKGQAKAGYGDNLMRALASRLAEEFGDGYGLTNLKMIRKFYLTYGQLVDLPIGHSPRGLSSEAHGAIATGIGHAVRDLKTGKLTHQDLGQLQLYVNYYDRERRTTGDNPTLGLILCADKNDAVVRYTLGPDQQRKIFASRYKLHLPSEAELRAEMRREVRALVAPKKHGDAQ